MRVFFLGISVGITSFLLGYSVSVRMERPTVDSPPPTLRGIQASPVDVDKMKGFRKGMGLE